MKCSCNSCAVWQLRRHARIVAAVGGVVECPIDETAAIQSERAHRAGGAAARRWGVPTEVTAAGSGSTGTVRPFGLDCSGFVDWTFYNATNGSYYPGAAAELPHSTAIARTFHGATRSRAILYSIQTIPTSALSAARTRTATC